MIFFFWFCLALIAYTFVGYGLLLYIFVRLKEFFVKPRLWEAGERYVPEVTLIVAAYNEEAIIEEKLKNSLAIDYPQDKLHFIFITDGSTDRTLQIVQQFEMVTLMHDAARRGKMAAIKRAMQVVSSEITVFTDANTFLNKEAIRNLVRHYRTPKVGAVAGEKRIALRGSADASAAGEGFYWKYESWLKRLDYAFYSNVGAAGELFSIRTALFPYVEEDTIIDDHMIAMRIAEKGYIIGYEPEAYASEVASENTAEELKRKIRIAAGGMQSILRLPIAANPFKYPMFCFQYISHRVLRWTIVPFLLIIFLLLNILLVIQGQGMFYVVGLFFQLGFYLLALIGMAMERVSLKVKAFFIPYYFCLMNYAVIVGIYRYFSGRQSAIWEKSKRKSDLMLPHHK
ncbi:MULTISPECIES: glycosyltransferase family 2 protein [Olivibacter]|jgi:cellulose synthase/poly-beta-1,6-N-acetylglucosamine synthase-like glycosyltransferase|uniref:Glycosyltransferase family 2 protein n=1 Tax=Olivibacter oleidegradans TaxID=760123 RepID=A0ABV6HNF5_9SPHI|nr:MULTISPECIES: glycosyltransferase family 2 protein [Olivibacter]MDX3915436.1 glycosyltransferase family 2 protein [Pseudosphingobacterium sp.]QEL02919.1 glycosyltransferase family 2 protein [Olivibacter sp. LS-1]